MGLEEVEKVIMILKEEGRIKTPDDFEDYMLSEIYDLCKEYNICLSDFLRYYQNYLDGK